VCAESPISQSSAVVKLKQKFDELLRTDSLEGLTFDDFATKDRAALQNMLRESASKLVETVCDCYSLNDCHQCVPRYLHTLSIGKACVCFFVLHISPTSPCFSISNSVL